ncbi:MAG: zinc ribbon domain-containing protein [Candidatus Limnocylindrales bacterium]
MPPPSVPVTPPVAQGAPLPPAEPTALWSSAPQPPAQAPVQPAARPPIAAIPITPAQPAARPPQAVPDDQPASRQPTAVVQPRPRPTTTVEQRVAQPGDRICGSCGEANDPGRKFCRRCGASLVEARVVALKPLPWWKRIFRRGPKASRQYAAGQRIGSMSAGSSSAGGKGFGGLLRNALKIKNLIGIVLGLAMAVGVVGYIGFPSFQGFVNQTISGGIPGIIDDIRRIVAPSLVIERPVSVTASSEVADHPVRLVFDKGTNTDWQATDKAPSITATFKEKIDVGAVILYVGSTKAFVDTRRPAELTFTFPDGTSKAITLQDIPAAQKFDLSASNVDSVVITITATNGPESAPVSISEIEFFKKT